MHAAFLCPLYSLASAPAASWIPFSRPEPLGSNAAAVPRHRRARRARSARLRRLPKGRNGREAWPLVLRRRGWVSAAPCGRGLPVVPRHLLPGAPRKTPAGARLRVFCHRLICHGRNHMWRSGVRRCWETRGRKRIIGGRLCLPLGNCATHVSNIEAEMGERVSTWGCKFAQEARAKTP